MKYIKLKCNEHGCMCEFLVALNDWYMKDYEGKVHEWYVCPICEGMVFTEEDCVIEI